MNDIISVCMATYNGEKYIKEQINSILIQLNKNDELIISDDGSTDNTLKIINEINDDRIKLFFHKKDKKNFHIGKNNLYVSSNFENALKKSNGKFIFLSDQDDIWMPDKVEKMIKLLSKKKCSLLMSDIEVINSLNEKTQENPKLEIKTFANSLKSAKFLGCTMAFDNQYLKLILPFPKYTFTHDAWIALIGVYNNKLSYINEPLIKYRRHDDNVTKKISNPIWFKIFYRLYYLILIIKRSWQKKEILNEK